jgi:hypothetical protein
MVFDSLVGLLMEDFEALINYLLNFGTQFNKKLE